MFTAIVTLIGTVFSGATSIDKGNKNRYAQYVANRDYAIYESSQQRTKTATTNMILIVGLLLIVLLGMYLLNK